MRPSETSIKYSYHGFISVEEIRRLPIYVIYFKIDLAYQDVALEVSRS